ncbi:hypothetical protein STEG23_000909 [Scotinomys teguina]
MGYAFNPKKQKGVEDVVRTRNKKAWGLKPIPLATASEFQTLTMAPVNWYACTSYMNIKCAYDLNAIFQIYLYEIIG